MLRALFEKTGKAVYISHLDLMRLFQRAFKRAGLPLTHTQGFSPRPSVSIALPLSVGVESHCELLDFTLDGVDLAPSDIAERLNSTLTEGIRVLDVYESGDKVKNIAYLDCLITCKYDSGIPENAPERINDLLSLNTLIVDRRSKNGITQQDIIPMLRRFRVHRVNEETLCLEARICCQNPSLNPTQITAAIERYLPELKPDFARHCRIEIYKPDETIFR